MISDVFFIPARRDEGDEVLAERAERLYLKTVFQERIEEDSFVALKIHFGDKGNTGHIRPSWLIRIIRQIKKKTSRVFFSDTNTLYVGQRSNSIEHIRLAADHGFSLDETGIPVLIADGLIGRDEDDIQVNQDHIKSAKIASAYLNTDGILCLSHFTGHMLSGFGAAIKNLGMGCASRAGKLEQHSDVHPWISKKKCTNCGICLEYCPTEAIIQEEGSAVILDEKCIGCGECLVVCTVGAVKMKWDEDSRRVQEKMTEYAFSLYQKLKGKIVFMNFLTQITKDCDCMATEEPDIVEDIGILASEDPVAVDKASVDLVNGRSQKDLLRENYDLDWSIQLSHGERIGLGSQKYRLIDLG
jgi:hypothetical protein